MQSKFIKEKSSLLMKYTIIHTTFAYAASTLDKPLDNVLGVSNRLI